MKATFIGVPGEQHDSLYMYGQVYPLGKAIKVNSPLAIRKLANHPHFTSTPEASDEIEDVKIKNEFAGAAEAVLAPIEEAHQAEALSIEEATNGNAIATGRPDPAQAEGTGPGRNGERQRRGQGARKA